MRKEQLTFTRLFVIRVIRYSPLTPLCFVNNSVALNLFIGSSGVLTVEIQRRRSVNDDNF